MVSAVEADLIERLDRAIAGSQPPEVDCEFSGAGTLESAFAVSEFASASIATAGMAAARLMGSINGSVPRLALDRALADAWFGFALSPVGWELPSPWDPLAGDYRTRDGWIRLHTNAPHHRAAALAVLGVAPDSEVVASAVSNRDGEDLEAAVVAAGGCAAVMRSAREWSAHPHGNAVASEALIDWRMTDAGPGFPNWAATKTRPLAGVRVLDLTRVLAGPVATRFLAGLGAEVLRVDPPDWDEPGVVPEVTIGKRTARLDARTPAGLGVLRGLLSEADVIVHGYRSDALERLGLGEVERSAVRLGLVDVSIDAYGFTGPWRTRRGFDSLVQMSTGIAEAGMRWRGVDRPVPLPVQALDHAAGYLVAAAAIEGLRRGLGDGRGHIARLSLARCAAELVSAGRGATASPAPELERRPQQTHWGPALLLAPPVVVGGASLSWDRDPRPLGSDRAAW